MDQGQHRPRNPRTRLTGRPAPAAAGNSARRRPAHPPAANDHHACRLAMQLARALHVAGPEPAGRKRLLLAGLCQVVGAERGVLAVTRTDLATARQELVSVVAGHLRPAAPAGRPVGRDEPRSVNDGVAVGRRAPGVAGRPTRGWTDGGQDGPFDATAFVGAPFQVPPRRTAGPGGRLATPTGTATVSATDGTAGVLADVRGPCLDAFLPLDGLRLVACLMLARPPGRPRFSADNRALVELLHEECRWVYAHDRRLAAEDVWALPPTDRGILQDLLAGHDAETIARRTDLSPAAAARRVAAVLGRFGARSPADLLARWAE